MNDPNPKPTPTSEFLTELVMTSNSRIRLLSERSADHSIPSLRLERISRSGGTLTFAIHGDHRRQLLAAIERWVKACDVAEDSTSRHDGGNCPGGR
jgi:hypothetical protein